MSKFLEYTNKLLNEAKSSSSLDYKLTKGDIGTLCDFLDELSEKNDGWREWIQNLAEESHIKLSEKDKANGKYVSNEISCYDRSNRYVSNSCNCRIWNNTINLVEAIKKILMKNDVIVKFNIE